MKIIKIALLACLPLSLFAAFSNDQESNSTDITTPRNTALQALIIQDATIIAQSTLIQPVKKLAYQIYNTIQNDPEYAGQIPQHQQELREKMLKVIHYLGCVEADPITSFLLTKYLCTNAPQPSLTSLEVVFSIASKKAVVYESYERPATYIFDFFNAQKKTELIQSLRTWIINEFPEDAKPSTKQLRKILGIYSNL